MSNPFLLVSHHQLLLHTCPFLQKSGQLSIKGNTGQYFLLVHIHSSNQTNIQGFRSSELEKAIAASTCHNNRNWTHFRWFFRKDVFFDKSKPLRHLNKYNLIAFRISFLTLSRPYFSTKDLKSSLGLFSPNSRIEGGGSISITMGGTTTPCGWNSIFRLKDYVN